MQLLLGHSHKQATPRLTAPGAGLDGSLPLWPGLLRAPASLRGTPWSLVRSLQGPLRPAAEAGAQGVAALGAELHRGASDQLRRGPRSLVLHPWEAVPREGRSAAAQPSPRPPGPHSPPPARYWHLLRCGRRSLPARNHRLPAAARTPGARCLHARACGVPAPAAQLSASAGGISVAGFELKGRSACSHLQRAALNA